MDIYECVTKFYESVKTEKTEIGKSLFGHTMYAFKVGEGSPVGLVQYAIHGREFITAELAFEQYRTGVKKGSCWFLPLMNPDGALLSQVGLDSVKSINDQAHLLMLNEGKRDFSQWKANGRGVDLNVNFPALWGMGGKNVRVAGAENYIGERPFSEFETIALRDFTRKISPDYTVSYHTKGEEIYWYFYQSIGRCARDKKMALALSETTGYKLAHAKNSAGGYKDWCIRQFGVPSFTVEAGADDFSHPLGEEALSDIIEKNRTAIFALSEALE